ncbi:MAG: 50S ribosomal protein L23 [Parcubacteria group bacterium]
MSIFKKDKPEVKRTAKSEVEPAKSSRSTKPKTTTKAVKKKSSQGKKKTARLDSGAYRVLVRPLISEKATFLSGENKYVFEVNCRATKPEIKQAVKDVYGVEPIGVNVISVEGKARRYGRTLGRTKNRKKAIVTLLEGQSIQVYEGV